MGQGGHIEIHYGNGTIKKIDLGPMLQFIEKLEQAIKTETYSAQHVDFLKSIQEMDKDQLVWLASHLASLCAHYGGLWLASFTQTHFEWLKQCQELRVRAKAVGIDLWPELDK